MSIMTAFITLYRLYYESIVKTIYKFIFPETIILLNITRELKRDLLREYINYVNRDLSNNSAMTLSSDAFLLNTKLLSSSLFANCCYLLINFNFHIRGK